MTVPGRVPRSGARRPPVALLVVSAAVAAGTAVPLAWVVRDALADGFGVWGRVWSGRLPGLIVDTLGLAALVTLGSVVLGVALAVLVVRTDLPLRRAVYWSCALPLAVPPFVGAIAYADLLGPKGPVDRAIGYGGFLGLDGATTVLTFGLFPYVFLVTAAALAVASPEQEEAARSLGLGRMAVWLRVTLPGLRPAICAGALLVALHVLAEFGTIQLMRYDTFTTAIYDQLTSLRLDRVAGAALSLVLVAITVALLVIESRIRGRGRPAASTRPAPPVALGRWRWPALAGAALAAVGSIGLPVGWLVHQSLWGARAPEGIAGLSGLSGDGLVDFLGNSLQTAGGAALFACALALPAALLAARWRGWEAVGISTLTQAGYALPGIVVALALIGLASGPATALAGTVTLLVLGHVVRYLPEAVQAIRGSLARVPPAMEEAARSLGSRPLAAFARTTLRLASGGVLAGALLVFLSTMKELPATLILRPPGFDTLSVRVWVDASEGLYREAAPPALLLVAACAAALVPIVLRRKGVSAL